MVVCLWFLALYFALALYSIVLAVAAKWCLIGTYKEGIYPLWGFYHLRWWFSQNLLRFSAMGMFKQTALAPFLFRLMGSARPIVLSQTCV